MSQEGALWKSCYRLLFLSISFHFSFSCWAAEVGTFTVGGSPPATASLAEATPGVLREMKPDFPQFYIWRKVHKKSHGDSFRLFLLKTDGSLAQAAGNKDRFQEITKPNDASQLSQKQMNGIQARDLKADPSRMELKYNVSGIAGPVTCIVDVPRKGEGDWFCVMGWHPSDGYLYLRTANAADKQDSYFYQFDPWQKEFFLIGKGIVGKPHFNVDGHWLAWVSGGAKGNSGRQIHVYNVRGNVDYELTSGETDNLFYKWSQDFSGTTDEELNGIIAEGKKYFYRRRYNQAINKYQEAIHLYPRSDVAFGLMGYCYLKQGKGPEAMEALRKSLDLNPGNYLSRYNLVLALWANGLKEDSMEELKYLLKMQPEYGASMKKDGQFNEIIQSGEYQQAFTQQTR
jgi:tetratricopeptide (TPR) repeat protein